MFSSVGSSGLDSRSPNGSISMQVEYKIICFISVSGMGFSAGGSKVPEVT